MFTKEGIDTKLSEDLSQIYESCLVKRTKFWSCIIIKIKGNPFGKFNLCLYKDNRGKYLLTDGGFIFNHIVQGRLTAKSIIPDINKYMEIKYNVSFLADKNVISFKVHKNYTSLSKGVAAFFMLLSFIIKSSSSPNKN